MRPSMIRFWKRSSVADLVSSRLTVSNRVRADWLDVTAKPLKPATRSTSIPKPMKSRGRILMFESIEAPHTVDVGAGGPV